MDYEVPITAGFGLLLIGMLTLLMAHQVQAGTLRRDGGFGIRLPSTMDSEASWRAGHQAAQPLVRRTGRLAVVAGITPTVLVALLHHWAPAAASTAGDSSCVAGYVVVLGMLGRAAVVADRAAGDVSPGDGDGRS